MNAADGRAKITDPLEKGWLRKVFDDCEEHSTQVPRLRAEVKRLRQALEVAQTALNNAAMFRPCPLYNNAYNEVTAALAPEGGTNG